MVNADALFVLSMWLDQELTLQKQLDMVASKLVSLSAQLAAGMTAIGFGLPFQVAQHQSRVEASVFYGAEVLASYFNGWQVVFSRLDAVHYQAVKSTLGAGTGLSLGDGGQARLLYDVGFSYRLSTRLALRICTTRARLLMLPPESSMSSVIAAAGNVVGGTWLDDAKEVIRNLGIQTDVSEFICAECLLVGEAEQRKAAVNKWKQSHVIPVLRARDEAWFREKLVDLAASSTVPVGGTVLPWRQPRLLWAP